MKEYFDVDSLRDDSLMCKYPGIRHSWDKLPESSYELNDLGERVYYSTSLLAVRCERCGREKFEFFDLNGRRMGKPYYRNPTDFQHTHRLDSADVVLEFLARGLLVNSISNGKVAKKGGARRSRSTSTRRRRS